MTPKTRPVGRPRSIDLEGLLDAAATMDLTTISMKSLADKLGVGVATIYRYVSDRDSLIRLASARAAHHVIPDDIGQDWRSLLVSYADSISSAFSRNPSLMHAYVDGHLGVELELEIVDCFLKAMKRRGFAAHSALEIFHTIGILAMGTAATALNFAATPTSHDKASRPIAAALDQWGDDELTSLRPVTDIYARTPRQMDMAKTIAILITGLEGMYGDRITQPA